MSDRFQNLRSRRQPSRDSSCKSRASSARLTHSPGFGFKNEGLVTASSRANGLCCRPRAEIEAELKTITDRTLTVTRGLSK
jgi:hypothetical protein